MKNLLRLEEGAMILLAVYLYKFLGYPVWLFAVLFLAPDIGMIGYLLNTRIGAFTYNLLHHKGIAIILYLAGFYFNQPVLQLIGIIIFAHSSFDRILGYGLKYGDSFKHTHLGILGSKQ